MTALHLHTSSKHDSHRTVEVIGPLVGSTGSTVRDQLRPVLNNASGGTVDLDLSCCTHLDLDGLFTLATLRDDLTQCGGDLRLVRVPPLIERFLRQHNFDHLIAHHATAQPTTRRPPRGKVVPFARQTPDAEAAEADVLEQHTPAEPDTPNDSADTPPVPMPAEADPADVVDQHTLVPLEDDQDDAAVVAWPRTREP